jgi:hypothetical protein
MRVIADIPHEACKITVFSWNGKYIVKLEKGMLEQTYKIDEFDVAGIEDIKKLLDEDFISKVMDRFIQMRTDLQKAMQRI